MFNASTNNVQYRWLGGQRHFSTCKCDQQAAWKVSPLLLTISIYSHKPYLLHQSNFVIITVFYVCFMVDFMQNVYVEIIPSCTRGPLDETDSINIICHVLHFGEVKWFKLDQEITDSRVEMGVSKRDKTGHWRMNSTLMLRNVTRSDAGSYVCSKSNGHNKTANETVFIDVAGKHKSLQHFQQR